MNQKHPKIYPMTHTEELLKKLYKQRHDLHDRILSPRELADYIDWMIETQDSEPPIISEPLDPALRSPTNPNSPEIIRRITSNPRDTHALHTLASNYGKQLEEHYLAPNLDISVGRMLRYMPAHWHTNDYFEVYYCFSGTVPIHFGEEIIHMHPGTVLIIAPSVSHASPCYQDDAVLYYYMIRSSTFDEVFWNQLPPDNLMSTFFRRALNGSGNISYLHFETGADDEIETILRRVSNEYLIPAAYGPQFLNVLMSAFFLVLLRRYEGTARLPRTGDFYWKHEFSAIFSFIQSHYNDMSLPEIAGHFGYSERQITRIVINCTGSNYNRLVLRLRMEKASSLLRQQDIPLSVVSELCGYANLSSFYRSFTKYYGHTPAEYRFAKNPPAP